MYTDPGPASLPIEPVRFEEHEWIAESAGMASRAQRAAGSGPYRSTIPARIADYAPSIPADLAADAEEAAAALARFDSYAQTKLGVADPAIGPMSSILLRTESAASSQIENLTVDARQLALAEIAQSTSDNAKMVAANVRAMEAALAMAASLDTDSIRQMHAVLLSRQRGWEGEAGKFRRILVWVGTSRVSPRGASHVAPQAELVPAAMDDLLRFVWRDDLPVLIQSAVAHAQFETIHPFTDGNGRTGRALVHAILRAKGIMTHTTAPVSAGLLIDTRSYFDALGTYRLGNARPIIEQFTRASRYASTTGMQLVDDLAAQLEGAKNLLRGLRPQAAAWKVLPILVAHPVLNAPLIRDHLQMSDMTTGRALAQLTNAGVLTERTGLKRNRIWQHEGIITVLDTYSQQLRRR